MVFGPYYTADVSAGRREADGRARAAELPSVVPADAMRHGRRRRRTAPGRRRDSRRKGGEKDGRELAARLGNGVREGGLPGLHAPPARRIGGARVSAANLRSPCAAGALAQICYARQDVRGVGEQNEPGNLAARRGESVHQQHKPGRAVRRVGVAGIHPMGRLNVAADRRNQIEASASC